MTPQAALTELLDRLAAQQGAAVNIGGDELNTWPADAVAAMKSARLLVKARPASSIVCPGCERECSMPVEVFPVEDERPARAFIFCDKPEDMGRIPVEMNSLERWQVTGGTLAAAVGQLLGLTKPPQHDGTSKWWTLGLLKGNQHKGTLKLLTENGAVLCVAGHAVPLTEFLSLDSNRLAVDRNELLRLVDKPAHTPGESAYAPSIARREARKLDTQQRYADWRKAAKALRRQPQGKSERWVSLQIAKMNIANGSSAETIRKHLRQ